MQTDPSSTPMLPSVPLKDTGIVRTTFFATGSNLKICSVPSSGIQTAPSPVARPRTLAVAPIISVSSTALVLPSTRTSDGPTDFNLPFSRMAVSPTGRLGRAEEIAELAVYLAGATYTSGQIHVIDGGWAQ